MFYKLSKGVFSNSDLREYMSTAWIIAIMLFVWLSVSGQRADMGFFNRIRLHTDIKVMCEASHDSIGWISYVTQAFRPGFAEPSMVSVGFCTLYFYVLTK